MNRVISFSNQKGGAGKTTTSREIAIYLANAGKKVLIIDSDPQGNLSKSITDQSVEKWGGLYEALSGENFIVQEIEPELFLLPGDIRLSLLEKNLLGEIDAHTRLKKLLKEPLFKKFEYIIIDTPPSLGVLTINALTASKYLIIPMNPALYSMQGTNDLMNTIGKVRKNLNTELSILGVIINSFDSIPVITRQIKAEIEAAFLSLVFKTTISKSIKIEEAIAEQKGVIHFDCKVKEQIITLGRELLARILENERGKLQPSTWTVSGSQA